MLENAALSSVNIWLPIEGSWDAPLSKVAIHLVQRFAKLLCKILIFHIRSFCLQSQSHLLRFVHKHLNKHSRHPRRCIKFGCNSFWNFWTDFFYYIFNFILAIQITRYSKIIKVYFSSLISFMVKFISLSEFSFFTLKNFIYFRSISLWSSVRSINGCAIYIV